MNAAVLYELGAAPRYTSFRDPEPEEGEILVDVIGAGLHPIVKALASGSHYGSTGARLVLMP
jgi:NADPH2:quinone reductase